MYSRYYKCENIKDFNEELYLDSLRNNTEVLEATTESHKDGYIPCYIVIYIRSTGNDVIVSVDENRPLFFEVMKSEMSDPKTTLEDEALLKAKSYLESVLTKKSREDMELPFKSFPRALGGKLITTDNGRLNDPYGAFMIMSIIVEQNYFDSLELNHGYDKVEFNEEDYSDSDLLTQTVAKTFITVHKPTGGEN